MKFKFKNALLAFAALAMVGGVGAGVALGHAGEAVETRAADELAYTITFGNNTGSASPISATTNASTVISSGTSYVASKPFTVNSGNAYYGDTKTCIRIGKSGNSASLSIALSESGQVAASKITVNCNNTGSKNVGAVLSVNSADGQTTTSTAADYEFLFPSKSTINSITLDGSLSIRIYSISVYTADDSVPSVSIEQASKNLQVEAGQENVQLTATTENAGEAAVVWSSSDTDVATIDSATGEVTALASGSTTITAKITVSDVEYTDTTNLYVLYDEPAAVNATIEETLADDSGNYKKSFNVTGVIKGWGIDGTDANPGKYGNLVLEDTTGTMIVYGCTADASALTWDGLNQRFAFANPQDFTTSASTKDLAIGDRLTLKLTRCDFTKNSVTTLETCGVITDILVNEVSSLSVNPIKLVYDQGESVSAGHLTVSATWTVRGVEEVAFSKLTISPATFTEFGDSITVTVTYGGVQETYTVKVNEKITPITSIELDKTEAILPLDSTLQLVGTILPDDTTETAVWSSSDESVATVDQTGRVTPVAKGKVTITLAGGAFQAQCAVTVREYAKYSEVYKDELTRETTGIEDGTTGYGAWSGKTAASDAVYAGQSAGDKNSIQLRSSNSNSGIVSTTSGGVIASVEVEWQSATTDGRTLNVYGSDTAYEDATDLYATASQGTLLGTIVKGTSTKLPVTGEYAFIGLRSNSGAMYLTSITITWNVNHVASDTDMDALDTLLDEKLYMSTINPSDTSSGTACLAFYPLAKKYFNGLSENQKDLFKNSDYCADAKARFETWAEAAGDSDPYDGQEFEVSAGARNAGFVFNNDSATWLTTISVLAAGALAAAGMIILAKKRKRA